MGKKKKMISQLRFEQIRRRDAFPFAYVVYSAKGVRMGLILNGIFMSDVFCYTEQELREIANKIKEINNG
jgi:hypothetical protein